MFLVVLIRCVRLSQGCNHFSRLSVGNKVDMVYYNLLMVVFDESQRSDCSAETVWDISECQFPRVLNVEFVGCMRTILSIPGY